MENLHSNPKHFADDSSLFSTLTDETFLNSHLNSNLSKINDWTYKLKMSFNTDSTKPALSSVQRNLMFTTLGLHFLTIYKAFIKPHLDCSDLICDKLFIESRHLKLESAQYSVALAITEAF